jgi:hypothetical protein
MALNCTASALNAVIGPINQLSPLMKKALLVKYLWLQKNPANVGQVVPASALLAQAAQFDIAPSDSSLASMEVWIHRQAAIDAGAAIPAFSAGAEVKSVACFRCLAMDNLRAMEIMLKCQLA